MFRGLLYTLFWDGMGHTLMTYDIHHNEWNEIDVQLPESLQVPQLAVACDHLFHGGSSRFTSSRWREKTSFRMPCKLWTAMPSKKCMKVYEDGPWSTINNNIGLNSNFTMFGSKSIIYVMRPPERLYYFDFERVARRIGGRRIGPTHGMRPGHHTQIYATAQVDGMGVTWVSDFQVLLLWLFN